MGHKIKHITIQKLNHLASGACWKVQKLSYSHECVKVIVLGVLWLQW